LRIITYDKGYCRKNHIEEDPVEDDDEDGRPQVVGSVDIWSQLNSISRPGEV